MCFVCMQCGIITAPREPQTLKVVETRQVFYPQGFDEDGKTKPDSRGWEVVKEIAVCQQCAKPNELDFKVVH